MKPEDIAKKIAIKKFGPNASCFESIRKRFEQVKTDSDVIELIVPPAQPTRCACIKMVKLLCLK